MYSKITKFNIINATTTLTSDTNYTKNTIL